MTGSITLLDQWVDLKTEQPYIRVRDAAEKLEVSELELIDCVCGASIESAPISSTRLATDEWWNVLLEMGALGKVMALTRNESVVHERKGTYLNAQKDNPHVALFVGKDIDLRVFLSQWAHGYAVTLKAGERTLKGFQFFNKYGDAIHKIYLQPESDVAAYEAIVAQFKASNQDVGVDIAERAKPRGEMPDQMIDAAAFQEGWVNLKDTHDFFMLLAKHRITRTQALRLAPEGNYAVSVANNTLRATLEAVSANKQEIMVFVGNKGMLQIHTGLVENLEDRGGFLNVFDPEFSMHIKEDNIGQSWIVRKPTVDGTITALEVYDKSNELMITLFGKRKPGNPELTNWTELLAKMEQEHSL